MSSQKKNPLEGTRPLDAAAAIKGIRAPELDVDWLGMDPAGAIAVFLGGEETPVPSKADPDATSAALERIAASVRGRVEVLANPEAAYRVPGSRTQDPIFDVPVDDYAGDGAFHSEHHEAPFSGYPHLVCAVTGGETLVRSLLTELGGREVLARGVFAVSFEVLGPISYEELHQEKACAGCRVLDDPNDPRPRSPEALASSGLYVYGWTASGWVRIASPSVAADRGDLQDVGIGGLLQLPEHFEASVWLRHR